MTPTEQLHALVALALYHARNPQHVTALVLLLVELGAIRAELLPLGERP